MDIYHYSPINGEFVAAGPARPDPLEDGVFLIPAHATAVAPPVEVNGKARCFLGGAWTQQPDHRGETWWQADGTAIVIDTIGDPISNGLLATEPPAPAPTAADVKAEAGRRIGVVLKDEVTQRNMNALAAKLLDLKIDGSLDASGQATLTLLKDTFAWVEATQQVGRTLAPSKINDENEWPTPPAGLADLVAQL